MNHAEPDHGSAIPHILAAAPGAELVLTAKGIETAQALYRFPHAEGHGGKGGRHTGLGGKTLRFVDAPYLHWPETMFTYCPEAAVLFTCDFLGSHIAADVLFADQVGDIVLPEAKRYYAEIIMPFARPGSPGPGQDRRSGADGPHHRPQPRSGAPPSSGSSSAPMRVGVRAPWPPSR